MVNAEKITKERADSIKAKSSAKKNEKSADLPKPAGRFLRLHQTIGNKALQRVLESKFIQAKLTIGQPNDIYEQEADRIADAVMRMPRSNVSDKYGNHPEQEVIQRDLVSSISRFVNNKTIGINNIQRYAFNVHNDLTGELAVEANFSPADANRIGRYDQSVDEGWTHPWSPAQVGAALSGNDALHFKSRTEAESMVEAGIQSGSLSEFGTALHSYQDSFSHSFPPGAAYNIEGRVRPADHSLVSLAARWPARAILSLGRWDTASGTGAALRHAVLGNYPDRYNERGEQAERDGQMRDGTLRLLSRFHQAQGYPSTRPPLHTMSGRSAERQHINRSPRYNSTTDILNRNENNVINDQGNSHDLHNIESKINSLKNGGRPLSEEARNFFEPRFGIDFSSVKIHVDANANQLARALNAKAFTKGSDIVFGAGEYNPASSNGKRLLGHELTHIVQQSSDISTDKTKKPVTVRAYQQSLVSRLTGFQMRRCGDMITRLERDHQYSIRVSGHDQEGPNSWMIISPSPVEANITEVDREDIIPYLESLLDSLEQVSGTGVEEGIEIMGRVFQLPVWLSNEARTYLEYGLLDPGVNGIRFNESVVWSQVSARFHLEALEMFNFFPMNLQSYNFSDDVPERFVEALFATYQLWNYDMHYLCVDNNIQPSVARNSLSNLDRRLTMLIFSGMSRLTGGFAANNISGLIRQISEQIMNLFDQDSGLSDLVVAQYNSIYGGPEADFPYAQQLTRGRERYEQR